MAFVNVTNGAGAATGWQYNNSPSDPGAGSPFRPLWQKQTNGIRTDGTHKVYTEVRRTGETALRGELSKSYWDSRT